MATYKGVVPSGKYSFNAGAQTVTFDSDYTNIALSDIMLITNVKSGTAIIIYDPFDPAKGGSLSGLILTLNYYTAPMSDTDPLQVIVGMTSLPTNLPTDAATETTLSSINTKIPSNLATAAGRLLVDNSQVTQPVILTENYDTIGYIANTSFGIDGNLPGFATIPSFSIDQTVPGSTNKVNIGTDGIVKLAAGTNAIGSITNSSFGISGNLPAFSSIPTFKIDQTIPGTTNKVDIGTNGTVAITGTVGVTGTFWQATQPVSLVSVPTHAVTQSGTWTVATNADGTTGTAVPSKGLLVQGSDGTNARNLSTTTGGILKVDLSSTAVNSTAIKVDGSATTQPVSGTITANIGTSGSLALDATLTGGTQKAITRGGAKGSTTAADVTSTSVDANTQALDVSVKGTATVSGTVSVNALPTGTNSIGNIGTVSTVTNLSQLGGTAISMNTGVRDSGTQRVTIATNDSVPVTGTFWQATQPVSGTVTANISGSISNTSFAATQSTASSLLNKPYGAVTTSAPTYSNSTDNALSLTTAGALRVDGSGVTQPVSLTSLPALATGSNTIGSISNISGTISLPTGAATAAKQPALGTAGTASADVITVQGIASMTALKVDGSGFTQPISISAGQTVTVTQTNPVSLKTQAENYQGGTAVSTSNPLQVTLANTGVNSTAIKVDGSAVTQPISGSVTVSGTVTANAGTNLNTSLLALETGGNLASIKTNTDNLALAQGSTTSGQKGNLAMASVSSSAPAPTTNTTQALSLTTAGELRVGSDGCTAYQVVSTTGQNLALIKTGATKVYGWYIYNNAVYPKKVILYDAAASASVTVGTTIPLVTLVIPASSGANVSLPIPLAVSSGLCIAMTGGAPASTTMQNSDTTQVTANDLNVNILYK